MHERSYSLIYVQPKSDRGKGIYTTLEEVRIFGEGKGEQSFGFDLSEGKRSVPRKNGRFYISQNRITNAHNGIMLSGVFTKPDWTLGVSRVDDIGTVIRRNSIETVGDWAAGIGLFYVDGPLTITGNRISNSEYGILSGTGFWEGYFGIPPSSWSTKICAYFNSLARNTYGVFNVCPDDPTDRVKAGYNWWGARSGPLHPTLNPSALPLIMLCQKLL